MSDENPNPDFDLLAELRAHHRAMNDDFVNYEDFLALHRAVARHYDRSQKLWSPTVLSGLQLLEIEADEWLAIVRSQEEAFSKIFIQTAFPIGDFSKEDFILGAVKNMGLKKAAQTEIVSTWLPELLSEGKADFFETLARAIREARAMKADDIQTIMPDGSMRDRATWALVSCWISSPFPDQDLPPFAFWTCEAITDFFEKFLGIAYGREGIRRRIREYGLEFASKFWLRSVEDEHDGSGVRPTFKKRRRSVKGHKSDKKP